MTLEKDLKALGTDTEYKYEGVDATLLEKFPNPFWQMEAHVKDQKNVLNRIGAGGSVQIKAPEFTSLCPKTGQPDFATIVIDYIPKEWCVESKSLKLYLGSYRNHGEFHEACVCRIINDLVKLLEPLRIQVEGQFTPRGGIPFWPVAYWQNPQNFPEKPTSKGSKIVMPPSGIMAAN